MIARPPETTTRASVESGRPQAEKNRDELNSYANRVRPLLEELKTLGLIAPPEPLFLGNDAGGIRRVGDAYIESLCDLLDAHKASANEKIPA